MFNIIPIHKQVVSYEGNQIVRYVRVKDANELHHKMVEKLISENSKERKEDVVVSYQEQQKLLGEIKVLKDNYTSELEEKTVLIKNLKENCQKLEKQLHEVKNENGKLRNCRTIHYIENPAYKGAFATIESLRDELSKTKQECRLKGGTIEDNSRTIERLSADNRELYIKLRAERSSNQSRQKIIMQQRKEIADLKAANLVL